GLTGTSTCAAITLPAGATCSGTTAGSSAGLTVNPNGQTIAWRDLQLSGGAKLTIQGGTYNVRNVSQSGGSTLTFFGTSEINLNLADNYSISGNSNLVILNTLKLNIANSSTNPMDLSGGTVSNPSYNPVKFQIQYGGTGNIKLSGGSAFAAVVYIPNSPLN